MQSITGGFEGAPMPTEPETTGRYLILFREDVGAAGIRMLKDVAGVTAANSADFANDAPDAEALSATDAMYFDHLGIAVVRQPPDQILALSEAVGLEEDSQILAMEPERMVFALQDNLLLEPGLPPAALEPEYPGLAPATGGTVSVPIDYLRGYREGINHLLDAIVAGQGMGEAALAQAVDEARLTWGLQATGVGASRFTGRGIRVAVLDTGLDLGHADFPRQRRIVDRSFVSGQPVQDGHGHGTHCIGTACGPRQPSRMPRYGVGYETEIFAGKVLSDQGSGSDAGILAGINWAIANSCAVISMSLGAAAGATFSPVFEAVGRRALAAGLLIVAAAGNSSRRPGVIAPVGHPANCPSIMAVGAVDVRLRVASFSCGGLNPNGGQVDIVGPGVDVLSSWPRPTLYRRLNGTSMATPHVAGIAALHAQTDPRLRGSALWARLIQTARRLCLPSRDVGAGLVQAP